MTTTDRTNLTGWQYAATFARELEGVDAAQRLIGALADGWMALESTRQQLRQDAERTALETQQLLDRLSEYGSPGYSHVSSAARRLDELVATHAAQVRGLQQLCHVAVELLPGFDRDQFFGEAGGA